MMCNVWKEHLNEVQNKSGLEILIKDFAKLSQNAILALKVQEDFKCFAKLLREKIIDLILKNGDIPSTNHLLVFFVFDGLSLEPNQDLQPYLKTARENFLAQGLGDYENLMLLELEVLCLMLECRTQEALKRYIQGISHLEIHLQPIGVVSEFVREYFPKMGVSMEFFLESIAEILTLSYYTSLPILRARSILNWQLHCFWNVSSFFNHRSWLKLYPLWKALFYWYLQQGNFAHLDHAMYFQFFIYHMCGNSFSSQEQWREFCKEIDEVACQSYIKFAEDNALFCKPFQVGEKIVIGILRDRIVENSPYKVEYSFLKQLLSHPEFKQRYTLKIYLMNLLEKSENSPQALQSYLDLGIEIVDVVSVYNQKGFYNSHLQKALALNAVIKQDKVSVLLSPNNGYGISDFVLSARSAPYQIFWSHGNFVYDIPSLDGRLTHICGNQTHLFKEGKEFVGIPVVMDHSFYNPPIPQDLIQTYQNQYPKDALILGTIGRLTKIDSLPYLTMLVRLMREFPQSIYLACGSGNIEEIQHKLRNILGAEYESFMHRFYFCGYVNSAIYGHLIDFWPDSFPMEQGESRIEYVAKGKLSLVLVKHKEQVKKEWITMAVDEEDYYQKALYLLKLSKQERQEVISGILDGLRRYNQMREELGVKTMLKTLETLCKKP